MIHINVSSEACQHLFSWSLGLFSYAQENNFISNVLVNFFGNLCFYFLECVDCFILRLISSATNSSNLIFFLLGRVDYSTATFIIYHEYLDQLLFAIKDGSFELCNCIERGGRRSGEVFGRWNPTH